RAKLISAPRLPRTAVRLWSTKEFGVCLAYGSAILAGMIRGIDTECRMKKIGLQQLSIGLGAGLLAASLGAAGLAGAAVAAPDAGRAQAREIFAAIVGIESSVGKGKV